ncbi:MAG TPA: hypothetical protein VFP61_13115 [Acidimicrobiales bacterium]|nr:hypothetical protein [Acidimicrobiales bacterium]
MNSKVLLLVAGAGAVVAWRRRHHRSDATGALTPDQHIAADPLIIEVSDDPDDVLRLLRDGWAHVRDAADAVVAMPTDGKAAAERARHAAARMVISAVQLDSAEEAVVWPVVRAELEGGADLTDEADRRGVELRRHLHRCDEVRPGDPTWSGAMAAAAEAITARDVWARTHVWPAFSKAVPARRRVELGHALEVARASAPTRPHLATPGAHPKADRLRAVVDRVADTATGRG